MQTDGSGARNYMYLPANTTKRHQTEPEPDRQEPEHTDDGPN